MLKAFLPDTADKIFYQLNTKKNDYESLSLFGALEEGTFLNKPEVLFKRIEKEK